MATNIRSRAEVNIPNIMVESITPKIFQKFFTVLSQLGGSVVKNLKVFMFVLASFEDPTLKGYDIVANAIGSLDKTFELTSVG